MLFWKCITGEAGNSGHALKGEIIRKVRNGQKGKKLSEQFCEEQHGYGNNWQKTGPENSGVWMWQLHEPGSVVQKSIALL